MSRKIGAKTIQTGDRRDQLRSRDLLRAFENRVPERLAQMQVAVDVLDRHDRVIDQNTDRERESAQRHRVQRLPGERQPDDGGEQGERDGRCHDQCRAPRTEKEQDHRRRQERGDHGLAQNAVDRRLHEQGLVGKNIDMDSGREGRLNPGQKGAYLAHHIERRGVATFQDGHQDRASSVAVDDVGLHDKAIVYIRDIPDENGRAACGLDRQIVQFGDDIGAVVQPDDIFARPHLGGTCRQNQILGVDRVAHVHGRQVCRAQAVHVDVHHDLAGLAAIRRRNRRAAHGRELGAYEVLRGVVECRFASRSGC